MNNLFLKGLGYEVLPPGPEADATRWTMRPPLRADAPRPNFFANDRETAWDKARMHYLSEHPAS